MGNQTLVDERISFAGIVIKTDIISHYSVNCRLPPWISPIASCVIDCFTGTFDLKKVKDISKNILGVFEENK